MRTIHYHISTNPAADPAPGDCMVLEASPFAVSTAGGLQQLLEERSQQDLCAGPLSIRVEQNGGHTWKQLHAQQHVPQGQGPVVVKAVKQSSSPQSESICAHIAVQGFQQTCAECGCRSSRVLRPMSRCKVPASLCVVRLLQPPRSASHVAVQGSSKLVRGAAAAAAAPSQ